MRSIPLFLFCLNRDQEIPGAIGEKSWHLEFRTAAWIQFRRYGGHIDPLPWVKNVHERPLMYNCTDKPVAMLCLTRKSRDASTYLSPAPRRYRWINIQCELSTDEVGTHDGMSEEARPSDKARLQVSRTTLFRHFPREKCHRDLVRKNDSGRIVTRGMLFHIPSFCAHGQ